MTSLLQIEANKRARIIARKHAAILLQYDNDQLRKRGIAGTDYVLNMARDIIADSSELAYGVNKTNFAGSKS